MVFRRSYRFRLSLTDEQAAKLLKWAGATRFVYNLALEQRRDFWRQARDAGVRFNYVTQGKETTQLRAEFDWLKEVPSSAFTQALRDLDRAFQAYRRGTAGFPNFRTRDRSASFRVQGRDVPVRRLNAKWGAVRVIGAGWLKFRQTRRIPSAHTSATFIRDGDAWFVSFACEREATLVGASLELGIDRGVANTLALSDGQMFSAPACDTLERRKRRAQRSLSRKKKGSARRAKQKATVARLTRRISNVRSDWRHKASRRIADAAVLVAIEDLKIVSMTARGRGKRGLNRSILERAWSRFEFDLTYKLEERGGRLVKVNPAYTSQECSACGTIDKASRESQASFACRHCGFAGHADTNAAINILRRGTALMRAEGGGYAPVEARTEDHALAA